MAEGTDDSASRTEILAHFQVGVNSLFSSLMLRANIVFVLFSYRI